MTVSAWPRAVRGDGERDGGEQRVSAKRGRNERRRRLRPARINSFSREVKGDAADLPVGFDLDGELGDDGTVLGKRRQWWTGRARERQEEEQVGRSRERERPGRHGVLLGVLLGAGRAGGQGGMGGRGHGVTPVTVIVHGGDRKSTRLNSSHITRSRMPSSA